MPLPGKGSAYNGEVKVGTGATISEEEKEAACEGEQRHTIEKEPAPRRRPHPGMMETPYQP